jgi:hypothetical protein
MHIALTEPKKRGMGRIIADMLFGLTPKVQPAPATLPAFDLAILVGPVWMGMVASPLRSCLKRLRKTPRPYAFLSISGGADSSNPKLAEELKRRVGREPAAVIDLHIADLLPSDPKPVREDTSAYRLSAADVERLTGQALQALEPLLAGEKAS